MLFAPATRLLAVLVFYCTNHSTTGKEANQKNITQVFGYEIVYKMMELPEPAICWLVENSASNEELARLSNVSKKWRSLAVDAIINQAKKSLNGEQESEEELLLLPSLVRCLMRQELSDSRDIETYCVSWFHPDGIQSQLLPIDPTNDTDEEDDEMMREYHQREGSPEHFAPSGQESYVGSEEERDSRRVRSKSPNAVAASALARRNEKSHEGYVPCMYQWNSYQEANQILRPFGFSSQFIQVSGALKNKNILSLVTAVIIRYTHKFL
jgi:hypothetical protein